MASGRPDWYSSVSMHGKFDDKYIAVAVDIAGHMLAKMQGEKLDETLKTIAVDDEGVMKANLSVQALPTLKTRPRYGDVHYVEITRDHPAIEEWTIPLGVVGQGYVLGGYLAHKALATHKSCYVELIVDGVSYPTLTFEELHNWALDSMYKNPVYEIKYDDTEWEYLVGFPYGWTFESTFVVKVHEILGVASTRGGFFYSLFK